MPPIFTIQLISIRCVTPQESDGDEIYLKIDGHTIWSVGKRRMHDKPRDPEQIIEYDFVNGGLLTMNGWESIPDFNPAPYRIGVERDRARLELMERDMLLGDDTLGDVQITTADIGKGPIQLAFTAEGAHYMLTYEALA